MCVCVLHIEIAHIIGKFFFDFDFHIRKLYKTRTQISILNLIRYIAEGSKSAYILYVRIV